MIVFSKLSAPGFSELPAKISTASSHFGVSSPCTTAYLTDCNPESESAALILTTTSLLKKRIFSASETFVLPASVSFFIVIGVSVVTLCPVLS